MSDYYDLFIDLNSLPAPTVVENINQYVLGVRYKDCTLKLTREDLEAIVESNRKVS